MELVREVSRIKERALSRLEAGDVGLGKGLLISLGLAGVTGLLAQTRIPLPFSPVPVTGQVFAVLLIGFLFGKKLGVGSQLIYAGLGGLGIPWFAGLSSGYLTLAGPTGGYILGFLPGVYLVGWLSERFEAENLGSTFLIGVGGLGIIYLFGGIQLSLYLNISPLRTIQLGVLPFLGIDVIKVLMVSIVAWGLSSSG